MKTEKDFEELLKLFNKYKVKYCIIGAFAVGFYALPRYTKDMDILVEATVENGQRIVEALKDFGFESLKLKKEDFGRKEKIIQLGYEPVRVDLLTSIKGCSFKKIWENKVRASYGQQKVYFIGLDDLIRAKKVSNRKSDKIDLKILLPKQEGKKR